MQAASAESDFTIDLDTGEIQGYSGSGGEVDIPSQIDGVNVTSIEGTVFRNNPSITSLIIPQGVTSIGDYAYYGCINLTSITIPASVTSLGKGILGNCVKLETITLASTNTSYTTEDGVLYSSDKKDLVACPGTKSGSFTIPTGVENILTYAFCGCTLLTSVIMPDTVKTIGYGAFTCSGIDAASNLTSVTLSNSLTSIGEHAFSYCEKLQSIILPDSVTSIDICAFYDCKELKTVKLSASLTTIGNFAFSLCPLLDSITIPASVTAIGNYAFCNLYNPIPVLTSVFLLGAPPTTGYSVFGTASSSCKIYYINTETYTNPWNGYTMDSFDPATEYTITYHENGGSGSAPTAITAINSCDTITLAEAGSLTREFFTFGGWNTKADGSGTSYEAGESITMGASNIDLYALWTPIEIQSGDYKFAPGTHTITDYTGNGGYIVIPSTLEGLSVTTIGENAFYSNEGNYSITGIRIPSSVTTIYGGAFAHLYSLNSVFFEGAAPLLKDEKAYYSVFEGDKINLYYIDTNNFTAVDDKLDATQYVDYTMNPIAATDVAETDKANLKIRLFESDSASSVTHDVELPSIGVVCGSTITWSSSNTSVISNSGVVTRTSADTSVPMTATITYQGQTATKSFDLTVQAASGANDTPTGGGSSTTTPTITVSGSTATTTMTPTVSGGAATGSVTADQMSDALKKAQAAAGTSGTPNVTIQISGASGATSVGTAIPRASLQSLVTGGVGALTISGPTGSVSFDAASLETISGASGDVTVTIANTDASTLSDAARALVGSHPVFTFSVTSGGSAISQFGGDVTVSVPYTPAPGEDTNAIVIYYIAADGTPTMVQDAHYDAATGTVSFTTTHFSTYAVGHNKVNFTDVSDTAWYADALTFLSARGITTGTTATTFSPDATLTRGQFITLLLRAYGISAVTNPTDNFSDAGNTYYTGYLAAAKKLGITSGVGDNKFAPDNAITRQEMFTLLYNALKVLDELPSDTSDKTLSDFTDAGSVAAWAQDAMTALVKAGSITGSGGTLNLIGTTTRAEMAQVLYNLLGK